MLMTIAKRRFLANLITSRFLIAAVLIELLFVSSTWVLIREYAQRQREYHSSVQEHQEQLEKVTTYAMLDVRLDRPPAPLSVFNAGADRRLARSVSVAHGSAPVLTGGEEEDNPLLAVFSSLDLITVIQVILSLTVLLFSYDTVSAEKERGTLRLVLSNDVPRHVFLTGNFLGGLASLFLPLLAGFLSAGLLTVLHPAIRLDGGDALRIILIIPAAMLFLTAFYALGVLFSILMKRSATSLVFLLFIWVFLVMLLPPGIVYLARQIQPVESQSQTDQRARLLDAQWEQEMTRYTETHPRPRHVQSYIRWRYVQTGSLPYAYRLGYAHREVAEWMIDGSIYGHNLKIEYENKKYSLYHDYNLKLERQAALVSQMGRISPSWIFGRYADIVAATDASLQLQLMEQAEQYRQRLIRYIRDKQGLSSYRLITFHPAEAFLPADDLERIRAARGMEAVNRLIETRYDPQNVTPLDLSDIPRFSLSKPGPFESLYRALPELVLLMLVNILLFSGCWAAFLRKDVR